MAEDQNIEYKESWRDEYLKWICGFANANGGKIYIGKNDFGEVVGLKDSKKLLEDIPNKTKDILGILVDVNLHQTEKGEFIEISVEAYPYPVNYKGQYHYRSGSTKQELKGAALDKFLLQRKGKRWDAVPIPNVSINDLKKETFDFFRRKAVKAQRIEEDVLTDSNELLIDNLQLNENEYLKRAALLLFHPNPDKFVSGAYIKIGYFEADDDLKFQDEVHGNLFEQIEKTIDLLFSKYIKSSISYEGLNRVEKYEYPKDAVREALLNAVSHKDYSGGVPIQISVYGDKLIFWNEGQLPENWTVENLSVKHPSKPYNPDIANALFRSGYIESWGRGTLKIINECVQFGIPKPPPSNVSRLPRRPPHGYKHLVGVNSYLR
jgi:ATP-dependent DNA helicase RecG